VRHHLAEKKIFLIVSSLIWFVGYVCLISTEL
jgi:hypothetical protein